MIIVNSESIPLVPVTTVYADRAKKIRQYGCASTALRNLTLLSKNPNELEMSAKAATQLFEDIKAEINEVDFATNVNAVLDYIEKRDSDFRLELTGAIKRDTEEDYVREFLSELNQGRLVVASANILSDDEPSSHLGCFYSISGNVYMDAFKIPSFDALIAMILPPEPEESYFFASVSWEHRKRWEFVLLSREERKAKLANIGRGLIENINSGTHKATK